MVLVVAGRAVQRLEASARLGTSERTVERVDRMDRGRCGRGGAGVFAEGRVHLLQGWRMLQMETESARAELITTCLVVPWCRARGRDENMRTMTGYKGVGPGPGEAMGRRRGPRAMTKGRRANGPPTFQHSSLPVSTPCQAWTTQTAPDPGLGDCAGCEGCARVGNRRRYDWAVAARIVSGAPGRPFCLSPFAEHPPVILGTATTLTRRSTRETGLSPSLYCRIAGGKHRG